MRAGERWRATDDTGKVVIPDTVQGVLAARIDLLPAEEKRALLSASVVGRVFWKGPVDEVAQRRRRAARRAPRSTRGPRAGAVAGGVQRGRRARVRLQARTTRDVAYGTLRAANARVRMRPSPDGSNRQPASGIASSPTCSRITTGRRMKVRSPTQGHPRSLGRTSTQDPACVAGSVVGARSKVLRRKPMHWPRGRSRSRPTRKSARLR